MSLATYYKTLKKTPTALGKKNLHLPCRGGVGEKRMKIYGLTMGLFDRNWLVEKDGVKICTESLTKLFPNKNDRLDYAVIQMKDIFTELGFEDGMDLNRKTEDNFLLDLNEGKNISIQGSSERYTFEFFEQEVE